MKVEHIVALALSVLIGYLAYVVFAPFLMPIFWAVILVVVFYPYYEWLQRHLRSTNLASILACVSVALFLLVPMAVMGAMLAGEFVEIYDWAEGYLTGTKTEDQLVMMFRRIEVYIGRYINLEAFDLSGAIINGVKQISGFLVVAMKGAVKGFAEFFFVLFLAFATMFFLFKECDHLVKLVKDILPFSEAVEDEILRKTRVVITATIVGGVLVGAVQGILGGLAFWVLGIPSPILWGFLMFIMSFIPGIGTAVVWGPAAFYFFATDSFEKGVALLVWGALVVGLVDNLLRPWIVSGRTRLNPLLLFFSILGAVKAFGLIGIIAGPLILSLVQGGIEIYRSARKTAS